MKGLGIHSHFYTYYLKAYWIHERPLLHCPSLSSSPHRLNLPRIVPVGFPLKGSCKTQV